MADPTEPAEAEELPEVLVVAGMSGAGRSTAADALEDLGWFVIDNLPPSLIPLVADLRERASGPDYDRIALVIGSGPHHHEVLPALEQLRRSGMNVRLLYLDAATDVLVLRYKVERRRHHLSSGSLTDAVERERALLDPVRAVADLLIDTSQLNVHELRARISQLVAPEGGAGMVTRVVSFGFKHGTPTDVDLLLDCRFLPNPHWEELRPLTGRDEPVRDFVMAQPATGEFLERLRGLFDLLLPAFEAEGKRYLTIAFGCTGGRHRSVAVAEAIAAHLRGQGRPVVVSHRDVDR